MHLTLNGQLYAQSNKQPRRWGERHAPLVCTLHNTPIEKTQGMPVPPTQARATMASQKATMALSGTIHPMTSPDSRAACTPGAQPPS